MKKVHKERIQNWVKALRSGEYRQCKDHIKKNNSYCCLGVACNIIPISFEAGYDELPNEARAYYDLDADPELEVPQSVIDKFIKRQKKNKKKYLYIFSELLNTSAVDLNDRIGFNFDEIADCIEYTYLRKK